MRTNFQGLEDLPGEEKKGVGSCSPPDFEY